jgi:hypothetical protein
MTDQVFRPVLVALILAAGSATTAAAVTFPVINSATYDASTQVLTLSGENLTESGRTPTLGFNDAPLPVTTATATRITATLSNTTPPGSYRVVIHRRAFEEHSKGGELEKQSNRRDELEERWNVAMFDVTIGSSGAPGVQGPMGFQGPQGMTGPQGGVGPQGPGGAIGAQGAAGPTGAQGPTGNAGANGANGAAGVNGANGAKGDTGSTGAAGPRGSAGLAGAAGAAGAGATVSDVAAGGACGPLAGAKVTDSANNSSIVCDGHPGATGSMGPAGPAGSASAGSTSAWNALADNLPMGHWPPAMLIQKTVAGSNAYVASASLGVASLQWTTCNLLATSSVSTVAIDHKVMRTASANASGVMQLQGIFQPPDTGAVTFFVTCYDPGPGATAGSVSLVVMAVGLQP